MLCRCELSTERHMGFGCISCFVPDDPSDGGGRTSLALQLLCGAALSGCGATVADSCLAQQDSAWQDPYVLA